MYYYSGINLYSVRLAWCRDYVFHRILRVLSGGTHRRALPSYLREDVKY